MARRSDIVGNLQTEIDILLTYLPDQFSEVEIHELVKKAIQETGASSPQDMGEVMGKLMPQLKEKADGKLVNKIVAEIVERQSFLD